MLGGYPSYLELCTFFMNKKQFIFSIFLQENMFPLLKGRTCQDNSNEYPQYMFCRESRKKNGYEAS